MIDGVELFGADPAQRIELLRKGLPANVVTELARRMRWSGHHTMLVLHVSRSTMMRKIKAKSRLATGDSEPILSIIDLIGQVQAMVERSGDLGGFDSAQWVSVACICFSAIISVVATDSLTFVSTAISAPTESFNVVSSAPKVGTNPVDF